VTRRGSPAITPFLSPKLALCRYQERASLQLTALAGYSDETIIEAEIPEMKAKGQLRLRRTFSAPRSLSYTAVDFAGDTFVKTNVIYRLLKSEVKAVQDGEGQNRAISDSNYKFSFKGVETFQGRTFYVYTLKPRHKGPGRFKGKMFIDAETGHITRVQGILSKSPSWWIKHVEFTQRYADVEDFTMPVQMESVTEARIVGRVMVTIRHMTYEVHAVEQSKSAQNAAEVPGGSWPVQQPLQTRCTLDAPQGASPATLPAGCPHAGTLEKCSVVTRYGQPDELTVKDARQH
jgi:hypothetical protein